MKIYLRNKLIALFMLVSIVPLALIGWMAFQRTTVIIESLQYEKLETLAEKRAVRINELITERQRDVSLLAQFHEMPHTVDQFTQAFANGGVDSPAYQELNRKHGAYLSTYAASLGIIDLFMITPAGDIVFTTANESDIGTNLLTGSFKDSDWVQAINQVASGQTAEAFSIGNYKAADALSLFLMAPVMDEKRVAGVLAFQLTLEQLYALAMNYRGLGESGEMVTAILQGDEAVMATPTRHDPMAAYQRKVKIGSPDAKPIQEAVRGQTGTGTFTDYRGIPVIAAWRYLPALKLGMVLKIDQSEAFFQNQLLANWFMGLGAVLFLLVVAISLSIARIISKPIRALTRASSRMASGEVGVRVDVHTGDEIELLANAFNQMATQLDTAHEESAARDWLNTGITTLDDVMRGEKDLSQLCTDIITTLARYLEVQVGTLSLADHEKTQLILTGSYAYTPKSGASTTFRFGEGWVGQAAQEKKSICIDKVMDGHLTVTSALGELPPENILCMPFLYEGDVAGVIELGSLHALNDRQLQLVDQVSERVAIAIHAAQSRENLQVLLEETQAQSEELQTREEELRATNEELTDQAKRNQSKWKNKNDA